ncbi:response regulator transcription factor [Arachnia propionica]|nr:LuxR C-terminal-related transcriptional regulator [Arachnia propionica]VEH71071.1 Spore germination protein gerE [Arachnia propionica]
MAGVCVLEGEVLERSATMRLSARPEPGGPQNKPLRGTVFAALTDREYEVVEAVAEGLDNAEVAARLFMSEGTVRNHISSILAKLGLRNRTQVAVMYYRSAQAG